MEQQLILDRELIEKYDRSGPRYTSYPTAVQFSTAFGESEYRQAATRSRLGGRALSLYFHIPFCDTVCYYCACNKVVTKDHSKAEPYLERLFREIEMQSELVGSGRAVEQLHWGGGTPTFLDADQMRALMDKTRAYFNLLTDDSRQYAIEIDPRKADDTTIALLAELGFNRISLGVQDFDPAVQLAVNRVQPESETLEVLKAARDNGFKSISMDLIYGLPKQSLETFQTTLNKVIDAAPERLSVFNYAHLPERFKPQRRINVDELPSAQEKLDILQMTGEMLSEAGYVYIGMDHFAKPDDDLAIAQREGTLYRNFQGYATHADADLIGMGVSSIGSFADCYAQNETDIERYYERIDAGEIPIARGLLLNHDDRLRRAVITQLICHFDLSFEQIELDWDVDFVEYFSPELVELRDMARDGLLTLDYRGIHVTPRGQALIRQICQVFDAYQSAPTIARYSRMI
ncbi:MAG: oxygen-independent coproporphyrinogen III oxidase [bacterium]